MESVASIWRLWVKPLTHLPSHIPQPSQKQEIDTLLFVACINKPPLCLDLLSYIYHQDWWRAGGGGLVEFPQLINFIISILYQRIIFFSWAWRRDSIYYISTASGQPYLVNNWVGDLQRIPECQTWLGRVEKRPGRKQRQVTSSARETMRLGPWRNNSKEILPFHRESLFQPKW